MKSLEEWTRGGKDGKSIRLLSPPSSSHGARIIVRSWGKEWLLPHPSKNQSPKVGALGTRKQVDEPELVLYSSACMMVYQQQSNIDFIQVHPPVQK